MKKAFLITIFSIVFMNAALAAGTQYIMRVDGLACPYCAYGIEKKLKEIDGTSNITVDLDKGLVKVDVKEGITLTEDRMKQLFQDAGFTYRSMKKNTL